MRLKIFKLFQMSHPHQMLMILIPSH